MQAYNTNLFCIPARRHLMHMQNPRRVIRTSVVRHFVNCVESCLFAAELLFNKDKHRGVGTFFPHSLQMFKQVDYISRRSPNISSTCIHMCTSVISSQSTIDASEVATITYRALRGPSHTAMSVSITSYISYNDTYRCSNPYRFILVYQFLLVSPLRGLRQ